MKKSSKTITDDILLEEVKWADVRAQFKQIAPDIYHAIERLDLDDSYKLYRVRYPFGSMLIDNDGIFNVPLTDDQLVPINNPIVPKKLQDALGYSQLGLPMSFILSGEAELFVGNDSNEIEAEAVYSKGTMLAVRGLLDPHLSYHARRLWRMTAGVRTPYMLPSISDHASFERLRRSFELTTHKPVSQRDHWELFVEIANNERFSKQWGLELLLFNDQWLKPRNDEAWRLFRLTLMERSWKATQYLRNVKHVDRIWAKFVNSLRNKKATRFVMTMVRHLIEASLGEAISYAPYHNDFGGPFTTLAEVFLEVYGLKKYAPIIMIPHIFNPADKRPCYVSLQLPSIHVVRDRKSKFDNLITDTREIKHVFSQFIRKVKTGELPVEDTPFSKIANLDFEFYHADKDKHGELLPAIHTFDHDPVVKQWLSCSSNNEIACRNEFMRSCIKISVKQES